MRRGEVLDRLEELAPEQHGYVTRAQAAQLSVSDRALERAVAAGDLIRADHGVYRMRGAPTPRFGEAIWVAWLRLDPTRSSRERLRRTPPEAVASHRSAAEVYGYGDVAADAHEFTVTRRFQSGRGDVRFYRRSLDDDEWEIVDGFPVTRPPRLIADLITAHVDRGHIGGVLADALRDGATDRGEVATTIRTIDDGERMSADELINDLLRCAGADTDASVE